MKQRELIVVLNEAELRDYIEAGVPRERLRLATPEEVRAFEEWERECYEEDRRREYEARYEELIAEEAWAWRD